MSFRIILSLLLVIALLPLHAKDEPVKKKEDSDIEIIEKNSKDSFKQNDREKAVRDIVRKVDKEGVKYVLALLADPYVHMREVAFTELSKLDDKDCIDIIAKEGMFSTKIKGVKKNEMPELQALCAEILGVVKNDNAIPHLIKALKSADHLKIAAAKALGNYDTPEVADTLTKMFESSPNQLLKAASIKSLGKLKKINSMDFSKFFSAADTKWELKVALIDAVALSEEDTSGVIKLGLTDKEYKVRIACADALVFAQDYLDFFRVLITDQNWKVRVAAVDAAEILWKEELTGIMVEQMEKESGRMLIDIGNALSEYSGKQMPYDALIWKSWWESQKDKFSISDKPERDEFGLKKTSGKKNTKKKPSKEAKEEEEEEEEEEFRDIRDVNENNKSGENGNNNEDGKSVVKYFRLPVLSSKILFVFDFSGSMKNPARDGESSPEAKIDIAKKKTEETMLQLGKEVNFNILIYRYYSGYPIKTETQKAFPAGLLPNSDKNRQKALEFLRAQEPKGWGNFYEAISSGLEMPDVDSIMFLSDGKPSRGRYVNTYSLYRVLKQENRFQRIAINTILTGVKGTDVRFMKNLAEMNNGLFNQID